MNTQALASSRGDAVTTPASPLSQLGQLGPGSQSGAAQKSRALSAAAVIIGRAFTSLTALALAVGLALVSPRVQAQETNIVLNDFEVWSNFDDAGAVRLIPIGAAVINPGNACADADSYLTRSSMPSAVQSRVLAVALAAKASGRALNVRISGCSQLRPAIVTVWIR